MKQLNFLNEYFQNKALDNNSSLCLNMFLEQDTSGGKYPLIGYPTPGASRFSNNSPTNGVVRGAITVAGLPYFVINNGFYSMSNNGTLTQQGSNLATSTGSVLMASITNQIMFIDGTNAYLFTIGSVTLTNITASLPFSNPTALTSQDGIFLASGANSNLVYMSNPNDGTTWGSLAFASKGGSGDNVVALSTNKRYVYVLGQQTSEIWYNVGSSPMAFTSVGPGSFFYLGCAAPNSVAITGSTNRKERGTVDPGQSFLDSEALVFLAQSPNGGLTIVQLDQYKATQISNRAVTYQINLLSTTSDAIGYCMDFLGHAFYIITFPTAAVSFMYDFTTGLWSQLQSYTGTVQSRHISNCYCYAYGAHLVGDYATNTIYQLVDQVNFDNAKPIKRQFISPPGYSNGDKEFLDKLQIDLQTGVTALGIQVEISYDSGQTFTTITNSASAPAAGGRLYWTRLGMTQNAIVLRITYNGGGSGPFIILGALANIRKGIH